MSSWERYKQTMRVTPSLWSAAKANDSIALQELLKGADLNVRDTRGYSPLMLAAYSGSLEAAELLLGAGADANTADNSGNSALMGAAFKGDVFIIDLLIHYGADVAQRNHVGMTAIDFAVLFGRKAAQEKLRAIPGSLTTNRRLSVIVNVVKNCFSRAA